MSKLNRPRNLVLTGFMGTGKTTVAQFVAAATGLHFVDMDDEIVASMGMSIPQIFAAVGESGFRLQERRTCERLAAGSGQVIATGGGALVNAETLALMEDKGLVICLTAAPEVIESRLGDMEGRPLAPNWAMLLRERQLAYDRIRHQIDTTHKSPQQVAEEVIALWQSFQ